MTPPGDSVLSSRMVPWCVVGLGVIGTSKVAESAGREKSSVTGKSLEAELAN